MAARENEIGRCRCPVCGSTQAHLRVSVKQLAYIMCNACHVQVMARGDHSDTLMRAMHVPDTHTDPLPPPSVSKPSQVAAAAEAASRPAPAPARPGWGFAFGGV